MESKKTYYRYIDEYIECEKWERYKKYGSETDQESLYEWVKCAEHVNKKLSFHDFDNLKRIQLSSQGKLCRSEWDIACKEIESKFT